jgi:hypothetical protein
MSVEAKQTDLDKMFTKNPNMTNTGKFEVVNQGNQFVKVHKPSPKFQSIQPIQPAKESLKLTPVQKTLESKSFSSPPPIKQIQIPPKIMQEDGTSKIVEQKPQLTIKEKNNDEARKKFVEMRNKIESDKKKLI